jgi:[acyl-carrier-protein] S-malonyltransferase
LSKTAFLFPGQGAQVVGMGKGLYDTLPAARELFDRAADILGYSLADVCFQGPAEKLNSTVYSQPALFVCGLAALEKLRQDQPYVVAGCEAVAGLSLGEYNALVFADVMDFETGLKVVRERAEAMQAAADAKSSGMVSVLGLDRDALESLCNDCREDGEVLQIANMLCRGNIAVSGHKAACERIVERAPEAGAMRAIPLPVAGAFHTAIMESAVPRVADALAGAQMQTARIPVISNVDAQPHTDQGEICELMPRQVVSPVYWEDSVKNLIEQGFDSFYEIGSGRVLKGLMKRINRKVACENVSC